MKPSRLAGRSISGAGALAVIGAVGSQAVDTVWLTLIPAAFLLAVGLIALSVQFKDVPSVRGVMLFAGALSGLLTCLAVFGLIIQDRRFEPPWLGKAASATGWALAASLIVLGLDAARKHTLPRGLSVLIALPIPIGLAADRALQLLPGAFFLAHLVPSLSIAVLGIALMRAGARVGVAANTRRNPLPPGSGSEGVSAVKLV